MERADDTYVRCGWSGLRAYSGSVPCPARAPAAPEPSSMLDSDFAYQQVRAPRGGERGLTSSTHRRSWILEGVGWGGTSTLSCARQPSSCSGSWTRASWTLDTCELEREVRDTRRDSLRCESRRAVFVSHGGSVRQSVRDKSTLQASRRRQEGFYPIGIKRL